MRKRIVAALLVIENNQGGGLGITSDEIESATFPWALGGFDHEDVDPFLERSARVIRAYERSRPTVEQLQAPARFEPVTAAEAMQAEFTTVLRGYHVRAVDRFTTSIAHTIESYEVGKPMPLTDSGQVARKLFDISMRGYSELEVDEYLDRVSATLRRWESQQSGDDVVSSG
ncbi:MAG: DivIVA domain-containing protein [Acidimicrobiia bacterium]|nr:DivIVA domain-containing protein [Acidimicrobiia bacterium]